MTSVLYASDGAIATITLNRPERFNAFNSEMRKQMLKAVERAENDADVRIVIVKGEGPGFCAGADLKEGFSDSSALDHLINEYKPFLMAIFEGKKIYISQVHRSAAGIGGALAMTCDLGVMASDANIYLAFAAIGLVPDGGKTWHLLHGMGYSRALQAIIEARKIPAEECLTLGLVNKVVAPEELETATREWALSLAQGAPLAQQSAKALLRKVGLMSYGEAINIEAEAQEPLTQTDDFRNAVAAFANKQKPTFEGK